MIMMRFRLPRRISSGHASVDTMGALATRLFTLYNLVCSCTCVPQKYDPAHFSGQVFIFNSKNSFIHFLQEHDVSTMVSVVFHASSQLENMITGHRKGAQNVEQTTHPVGAVVRQSVQDLHARTSFPETQHMSISYLLSFFLTIGSLFKGYMRVRKCFMSYINKSITSLLHAYIYNTYTQLINLSITHTSMHSVHSIARQSFSHSLTHAHSYTHMLYSL